MGCNLLGISPPNRLWRNNLRLDTIVQNRVLESNSYFQKYLLSKLVLQSCDNFVIAPQYYDALSQDVKNAICRFYVDTILKNAENHDDKRLYLF